MASITADTRDTGLDDARLERILAWTWRTERGLIGQALRLSTVEVHTAAGSHEIPLLAEWDAGRLRARIAELARTVDG